MEEILYNLKLTTELKNQLLKGVGDVFEYSSKGGCKQELGEALASCILASMLLARRYGIGENTLERELMGRINTGIADRHICEIRFEDLSSISKFIRRD